MSLTSVALSGLLLGESTFPAVSRLSLYSFALHRVEARNNESESSIINDGVLFRNWILATKMAMVNSLLAKLLQIPLRTYYVCDTEFVIKGSG